jgi:hypothetical protein
MLTASLMLMSIAPGCALPERLPLPDWSDGYDNPDVDTDIDTDVDDTDVEDTEDTDVIANPEPPSGSMALRIPTDLNYPLRLRKLGGDGLPTDAACAIDKAAFGTNPAIDCLIDGDELDLHMLAFEFDLVVPPGLCDYVYHAHYMYESWKVGDGPTEVSYTLNADGTFSDEVNSFNGIPYCEYDYRNLDSDYPNCCTGSYTLTITDGATGDVDSLTLPWDANPADCYDGAAFFDSEAQFNEDGWPLPVFTYLNREAAEKRYSFAPLVANYRSNAPTANYYDPALHDGTLPAALAAPYARPYYTFQCVNRAEEVSAQIRLVVREWNEKDQFFLDGDPDTTGVEPAWGLPIDDWQDWDVLTPGSTMSPMGRD